MRLSLEIEMYLHGELPRIPTLSSDIAVEIDAICQLRDFKTQVTENWDCTHGVKQDTGSEGFTPKNNREINHWFNLSCPYTGNKMPIHLNEGNSNEPGYEVIDRMDNETPLITIKINLAGFKTNVYGGTI